MTGSFLLSLITAMGTGLPTRCHTGSGESTLDDASACGAGSRSEEDEEGEGLRMNPLLDLTLGSSGSSNNSASSMQCTAPPADMKPHSQRRAFHPVRCQRGRVSRTLLNLSCLLFLAACSLEMLADARPCTPTLNSTNATNATLALNVTDPSSTAAMLPSNATAGTWNNSTNSTNSTVPTTTKTTTTSITTTTPSPFCKGPIDCASFTPPPEPTPPAIITKAVDSKKQVTSDLAILNATIVDTLRQDMFAGVSLPPEANSILAAALIIAGVVSAFLGHKYMKVTVTVVAFAAGSVASMYPIDKVLGGTLCGEYQCAAGVPDELFCQWSLVAGLGVGLVCGGMAMRVVDAGSVIMGASIGLLVGLMAQPVVDQLLTTAHTPGWSHYMHYILFFGVGAGLGRLHPNALQISMSAVMGALMAGSGLSFFVDGALSPSAMMSGKPVHCSAGSCIAVVCGAVVMSFVGMFVQTKMHKRRMEMENGDLAEGRLDETLGATMKLVDKVIEREERVAREDARRLAKGYPSVGYDDLDASNNTASAWAGGGGKMTPRGFNPDERYVVDDRV